MSPNPLYTSLAIWLNVFTEGFHAATAHCLSLGVFCVLIAQSLRPADRARAVPPQLKASARARLQRNHRLLDLPAICPSRLTPVLVKMALRLAPALDPMSILIDTTRIGHWEVFYAALPFMGRTLPVTWIAIPYPWPKNAFRTSVNQLLDLINQNWPKGRGYMLVADRGFPSQDLFQRTQQSGQAWTVRLRSSSPVIYQGQSVRADYFISLVPEGQWRCFPVIYYAKYSRSEFLKDPQPVRGYLVVGHQEAEPARHKQGPASRAAIAKQIEARQKHACQKRVQRGQNPPSVATQIASSYWLLFTSCSEPAQVVRVYRLRMLIEETFRDWKSGWQLVAAITPLSSLTHVSNLLGLTLLSYRFQIELGLWVSQATEPLASMRREQWTVSGRMSLFWQAGQALTDNLYYWPPHLASRIHRYYGERATEGVRLALAA